MQKFKLVFWEGEKDFADADVNAHQIMLSDTDVTDSATLSMLDNAHKPHGISGRFRLYPVSE
jgi:hypothetical protein